MWIYIAEVVEPRYMALAAGAQWIGAAIVILSFPIITDNLLGGNPWMLYIFLLTQKTVDWFSKWA